MTAPDFVPVTRAGMPRSSLAIPPGRAWKATRPADVSTRPYTESRLGGRPGPDQGYALNLVERFLPRLQLAVGEHTEDVVAGCVAVAMRRASVLGRAPVTHDLELAFNLFGFLSQAAPDELIEWRGKVFAGAAHHYLTQRELADLVPEDTLRLTPAKARDGLPRWYELLELPYPEV